MVRTETSATPSRLRSTVPAAAATTSTPARSTAMVGTRMSVPLCPA